MNALRVNKLLIVMLATLVAASATAWVVQPHWLAESWLARIGMVSAALAATAIAYAIAATLQKRERTHLNEYVEHLCQLDQPAASNGRLESDLAWLGKDHPWRPVLQRLRESTDLCRQRLRESDHARTVSDVRVRRLVYERQQMSDILACLTDPVLAIDHYDELVLANSSAERLLDVQPIEDGRKALRELVKCEELVSLLTETRRKRGSFHRTAEITLPGPDGRSRAYRVNCSSVTTLAEVGTPDEHGVVAVLNDISNEKAMQRRNAEFVSAVSHEMKTPLAGIKAYVELLADGDAEDEQTREEFLRVIDAQADRLQRLVENMLNLARIEAGVVDVNKQLRSLNELLEEALEVVRPSAEQKEVSLTSELSTMYLGVLADRDMILQAAINLLSNAIKYTSPGGQVTLRSRMRDNEVVFEVEDTGVGLSDEDREKVFEKFYRVKKDRDMASGTGLGLPLAKHIVEDVHGGQLTVDSEPGQGSTFRVVLPSLGTSGKPRGTETLQRVGSSRE